MQFATCQLNRALEFLNIAYPSMEVTWEIIPKLKELVSKDIIRVQDPKMHKPAALVSGNNHKAEHQELIKEALEDFMENVHNK